MTSTDRFFFGLIYNNNTIATLRSGLAFTNPTCGTIILFERQYSSRRTLYSQVKPAVYWRRTFGGVTIPLRVAASVGVVRPRDGDRSLDLLCRDPLAASRDDGQGRQAYGLRPRRTCHRLRTHTHANAHTQEARTRTCVRARGRSYSCSLPHRRAIAGAVERVASHVCAAFSCLVRRRIPFGCVSSVWSPPTVSVSHRPVARFIAGFPRRRVLRRVQLSPRV